jgi:hypothetical protein
MAKSFLTAINLNNNSLLNGRVDARWASTPSGTTNPDGLGTAVAGQISSYNGGLYVYTGSAWSALSTAGGTVSSVSGTSGSVTVTNGSSTPVISLSTAYGDSVNPYGTKTANYVLAAPNGSNGAPTFRALVAADVPTLNQNTTGSAATLTTSRNINGTAFNGSADITVTAAASTLTGTTLNATVTGSSLTSVGTLASLDVTGAVIIGGNLTVNGTTTTINSTTISVDDKNIELGSVASPTDITADGAGITVKGDTDKTWNWVNSTDSWTSSEDLDLASGKAYHIADTQVLGATTLGSGVVNSSLTKVGLSTAGFVKSDSSGNLTVDTTAYPKKYAVNNSAITVSGNVATFTVTHSLNTTDVTVSFKEISTLALVEADVVITDANTVTISWSSASNISANTYRAVVIG